MRENEFREWLQAQGYDGGTVSAQLARVARLERAYGDLEAFHASGGLERLQRELAYTKDDERTGKPNPAAFAIDGNLYNGLASCRKSIDYYRQFLEADGEPSTRQAHLGLINRLSTSEIEAAMDDCDAVGVDKFLRDHGYVRPSNWTIRPSNGQRYPAKAIVAIAVGKFPGEAPLRAQEYFGGFGESQSFARLKELGYAIVGKDASEPAANQLSRQAVEAAMDEHDELGQSRFLTKYERGLQGTRYWVRRGSSLYPSKAIANAALEIQHGERGTYGGTEARRQLSGLGYAITDRNGQVVGGEMDPAIEREQVEVTVPTNLILYGPPGTGKTYSTAEEAVRLCDGSVPADREDLMVRYRQLVDAKQVHFVTFHQSYSYEDFVEGLRPVTGPDEAEAGADGISVPVQAGFRLEAKRGIFREVCALAEQARKSAGRTGGFDLSGRRFFKMSLGRAGIEDEIYDAAIEGGYIVLGWGGEIDWSDTRFEKWPTMLDAWRAIDPSATGNDSNVSQMWTFRNAMREGDIVIVSDGNRRFRAIGEVTGPYRYDPIDVRDYNHRRTVNWLMIPDESLPVETIYSKNFMQVSCYQMKSDRVNTEALARLLPGTGSNSSEADQFVLVIDEINRANISKVFGELITLIEPDKRLGSANALTVQLPYSGDSFGVPANLHIVGTMNTADRSIALLDTALRRRFEFRELMPRPDLLPEVVDGIPLRKMLTTLNQRIEYLFDREHQIGHAFFINCRTRADIDRAMRTKVIPLLQEYFYEDWEKVAQVVGDAQAAGGEGGFIVRHKLAPPGGISDEEETRSRWQVRDEFPDDVYHRFA